MPNKKKTNAVKPVLDEKELHTIASQAKLLGSTHSTSHTKPLKVFTQRQKSVRHLQHAFNQSADSAALW